MLPRPGARRGSTGYRHPLFPALMQRLGNGAMLDRHADETNGAGFLSPG